MTLRRTRPRVPYVKITARFHDHPKRERTLLGCAADGVLARALSYARDHETDGFVPDWFIEDQVRETPRHRRALRAELLKPRPPHGRPLFEEAEGGLRIHDFHEVNESVEEIKERRSRDRTRKRGWRNGRRQTSLEDPPPESGVPRSVTRDTLAVGVEEERPPAEYGDDHPRAPVPDSPEAQVVDQVLAILRKVPREEWIVDDISTRMAVETAIGIHPDKDPIAAASVVVVWASDPAWRKMAPGSVFLDALRKQEPAKVTAEARVPGAAAYRDAAARTCRFGQCDGSGIVVDEEADSAHPCRCHPSMAGRAA